jgi:ribosome-binding protein aMBF1 (putative translation factor)
MTSKAGRSFKDYKQELLEDAEVKQAYDALQKSYDIAKMIYNARTEANLTQEQLAKRIGTRQANISRAEKGSSNITVGTLSKIAEATGYELVISMKPIGKVSKKSRNLAQA